MYRARARQSGLSLCQRHAGRHYKLVATWVRMFWRCDAFSGSRSCPERLGSSEDLPRVRTMRYRNGVYIHTQFGLHSHL
eukprot:4825321-Prymnesium_polylepis.1